MSETPTTASLFSHHSGVVSVQWLDNFLDVLETLAPMDPNVAQGAEIILATKVIKIIEDLVKAIKQGKDPATTATDVHDKIKNDFNFVTSNLGAIKNLINSIFKRKVL